MPTVIARRSIGIVLVLTVLFAGLNARASVTNSVLFLDTFSQATSTNTPAATLDSNWSPSPGGAGGLWGVNGGVVGINGVPGNPGATYWYAPTTNSGMAQSSPYAPYQGAQYVNVPSFSLSTQIHYSVSAEFYALSSSSTYPAGKGADTVNNRPDGINALLANWDGNAGGLVSGTGANGLAFVVNAETIEPGAGAFTRWGVPIHTIALETWNNGVSNVLWSANIGSIDGYFADVPLQAGYSASLERVENAVRVSFLPVPGNPSAFNWTSPWFDITGLSYLNGPYAGMAYGTFLYTGDADLAFDNFIILDIIPEPSAILLLAVGGLLLWRQKRNDKV